MTSFDIYFDGACEPTNPGGNMGYGFLIYQEGVYILSNSFFEEKSKNNTNNVAEYKACYEALQSLKEHTEQNNIDDFEVNVFGDSMLVIKQMRGEWGINSGAYKYFALRTKELKESFKNISFNWIPREKNTDADEMSKRELKLRGIEETDWKNK